MRINTPAIPVMFLLPALISKPAVKVVILLPADLIALKPVLDLLGIIINKGLKYKSVANIEYIIIYFINKRQLITPFNFYIHPISVEC